MRRRRRMKRIFIPREMAWARLRMAVLRIASCLAAFYPLLI